MESKYFAIGTHLYILFNAGACSNYCCAQFSETIGHTVSQWTVTKCYKWAYPIIGLISTLECRKRLNLQLLRIQGRFVMTKVPLFYPSCMNHSISSCRPLLPIWFISSSPMHWLNNFDLKTGQIYSIINCIPVSSELFPFPSHPLL